MQNVVGRIVSPKDVHARILGTCAHVPHMAKGTLLIRLRSEDLKLKIFQVGPVWSHGPLKAEDFLEWEGRRESEFKVWDRLDQPLLALKMEKEGQEQGMWVASRSLWRPSPIKQGSSNLIPHQIRLGDLGPVTYSELSCFPLGSRKFYFISL